MEPMGAMIAPRSMEFNLADLFEAVADTVPDREALVCGPRRLTYSALDERTTRLAHGLAGAVSGLMPGAHVGLFMGNCVEYVEAMLACFKLRAVPININHRYGAEELAYLCRDAEVVALVHDGPRAGVVATAQGSMVRLPALIELGVGYEALLRASSAERGSGPRSADDHYIVYTGGTTGLPKGVVWCHEDIFFATLGGGNPGGSPISDPAEIRRTVLTNRAQRALPFLPLLPPGDPGPDVFTALALGPLDHASGHWPALGTLLGGGRVVLYPDAAMDMARVLGLVESEHVTFLTLVGDTSGRPLALALEAAPARWDTSSVLLLGSGGSILSAEVKERLMAAIPSVLAIVEGVGSSESPAQAVCVTTRGGSVLPTLRFTAKDETRVIADDGTDVAPGSGRVGRLATRGRVPIGYWNDPDRSERTFVSLDGARFALPGDMATVEADGSIKLIGRGSLCINTGGEKVYPEEVEAVLRSHPLVADAVVVGLADERWGERVVAVVAPAVGTLGSPEEGPLTLEELREHCARFLARYKAPRQLCLVAEVRRSPAGKADYRWAREVAQAGG